MPVRLSTRSRCMSSRRQVTGTTRQPSSVSSGRMSPSQAQRPAHGLERAQVLIRYGVAARAQMVSTLRE